MTSSRFDPFDSDKATIPVPPQITNSQTVPTGNINDVRELTEDESELIWTDDVQGVSTAQKVSSWGVSLILHAIVVLILAFLFFPSKAAPPEVEAIFSTEIGDQLDILTEDEGNLNPNQAEEYKLTVPEEVEIDDLIVFEEKELPFDQRANAPIFEQTRIEMSEMLTGRTDPGKKNDLLAKYGGTKLTEESVEAGLQWLRKQQQKDGSWSLRGPYSGESLSTSIINQRQLRWRCWRFRALATRGLRASIRRSSEGAGSGC